MLISKGNLLPKSLDGKLAIVTGAGQGIGLEAAMSLAWLGAKVVIAEINTSTGHAAAERINELFEPGRAEFIQTDIGSEDSVRHLKSAVEKFGGEVSIVINNATITPIGSAFDVPIERWDASYRVNLRGPALMAIEFLPGMIARNSGVFICVASLGEAYLAAYETLKVAQVRMASTLNFELEDRNVFCLSVNPGLVRTPRALECMQSLAPIYGTTMDEFIERSSDRLMSAEAAGAGFAAAAVLAEQFRGQEITSRQALLAAGIHLDERSLAGQGKFLPENIRKEAKELCGSVITTLEEQAVKWSDRSMLGSQWNFQEFKRSSGMSMENWVKTLQRLEKSLDLNTPFIGKVPLDGLIVYYDHLQGTLSSHQSDQQKLEEQLQVVRFWQKDVAALKELIRQ